MSIHQEVAGAEEHRRRLRIEAHACRIAPLRHRVELGLQQPALILPHESTVCDMLKRNGLIRAKPRRRAIGHPGRPSSVVSCPNDAWSADFKGQFRTGDGKYLYPLTVTDNYSRYLLACKAMSGTLLEPTWQWRAAMQRKPAEYSWPAPSSAAHRADRSPAPMTASLPTMS